MNYQFHVCHKKQKTNHIRKTKIMKFLLLFLTLLISFNCLGHPLPNSTVNIKLQEKSIKMQLKMPLQDFEIAFKNKLKVNQYNYIEDYFKSHIKIEDNNKKKLNIQLIDYQTLRNIDKMVGEYNEVIFNLKFTSLKTASLRKFTIYYDAIIHEIVNVQALVYISSDWETGIHESQQIGVIGYDIKTNTISPFHVSLEKGNNWKGFKSMFIQGIKHIYEGTDHLLFLLLLLITSPLIIQNREWSSINNIKYSLNRTIKFVTAFTIGHSIALIIGTFNCIDYNIQLIEILVATSILLTSVQVVRPFFYNKEIYFVTFFGLFHGLAFSTLLKDFELENNRLILSLLGFNLGIELIQILVTILIIPCLLIISHHNAKNYKLIRIFYGVFAGFASIIWCLERFTNKSNFISIYLNKGVYISFSIIILIASYSLINRFFITRKFKY